MLDIVDLDGGYDETIVLRNVNLSVPKASVVALLGPNGAGKTTLLRMASGLLQPARGQVLLDDDEITYLTPAQRAKAGICHIPEGRGIFPSLTVRDNLRMHCLAGQEEEMIAKAVEIFPSLGRRISALAGTMSGGEQQMLALARAYIQNPRLALLDEVSMGLAPVVVDEIFNFLDLLAKEGASMLLVEQYVTRALAIADYVYLLNRGEVRFVGEPDELEGSDIFKEYVGVDIG